jgi:hypothetical protein
MSDSDDSDDVFQSNDPHVRAAANRQLNARIRKERVEKEAANKRHKERIDDERAEIEASCSTCEDGAGAYEGGDDSDSASAAHSDDDSDHSEVSGIDDDHSSDDGEYSPTQGEDDVVASEDDDEYEHIVCDLKRLSEQIASARHEIATQEELKDNLIEQNAEALMILERVRAETSKEKRKRNIYFNQGQAYRDGDDNTKKTRTNAKNQPSLPEAFPQQFEAHGARQTKLQQIQEADNEYNRTITEVESRYVKNRDKRAKAKAHMENAKAHKEKAKAKAHKEKAKVEEEAEEKKLHRRKPLLARAEEAAHAVCSTGVSDPLGTLAVESAVRTAAHAREALEEQNAPVFARGHKEKEKAHEKVLEHPDSTYLATLLLAPWHSSDEEDEEKIKSKPLVPKKRNPKSVILCVSCKRAATKPVQLECGLGQISDMGCRNMVCAGCVPVRHLSIIDDDMICPVCRKLSPEIQSLRHTKALTIRKTIADRSRARPLFPTRAEMDALGEQMMQSQLMTPTREVRMMVPKDPPRTLLEYDFSEAPDTDRYALHMANVAKKPCPYAGSCYRMDNALHVAEFSHDDTNDDSMWDSLSPSQVDALCNGDVIDLVGHKELTGEGLPRLPKNEQRAQGDNAGEPLEFEPHEVDGEAYDQDLNF